jgi:hypothetical protein
MGVPEDSEIASARAEALDAVSEAQQWELAGPRWWLSWAADAR